MSSIRDGAINKVAEILCYERKDNWGKTWEKQSPIIRNHYINLAREALSIPELAVVDREAELPENPHSDIRTLHIKYNQGLKSGYIPGQNSLLLAGRR